MNERDAQLRLLVSPRDDWAAAELGQAELGDARRTRRLVQVATDLAAQPSASLPQACGTGARLKGTYRFFDLPTTAPEANVPAAIRASHHRATKQRLAGQQVVLAVQDTTSLDWTHHPATSGLGPLASASRQGRFVHSTLAVTTDGVPHGLLAQHQWARDPAKRGQRHQRRARPLAEKESQKWLTALEASRADLPAGVTLVHVGDRESDVYDLFVAAQQWPDTELLLRSAWDRRSGESEARLRAELLRQPASAPRTIELPRADERPARLAKLTVRWTTVTLRPPAHRATESLPPVVVDALLVQEVGAPAGQRPVEWLLLSTIPIQDEAAAWERVTWYTYRWRIERYHLVLKSGCKIEARQLESGDRLDCCLAVYCVIASWLLHLTYLARVAPDAPADRLLTAEEWTLVWAARHPGNLRPPNSTPTVRQAVREIAGLGGFIGRRRDGEPGVITLWRGLQRLHDLLYGYHLACRLISSGNVGNA